MILESIFADSVTLWGLFIVIISSIVLGSVITLTYKITGNYTKNMCITLMILPLVIASIILMVNGNLGASIAVFGAFSLVKFRSIPGNSRDITFIFTTMAIGLALGMGQILLAFIITLVLMILIIVINNTSIIVKSNNIKQLKILIPEDLDYENIFDDVFQKYGIKAEIIKAKTSNMGSLFEITYNIKYKNIKEKEFIDDLRIKNGNLKIILMHNPEGMEL